MNRSLALWTLLALLGGCQTLTSQAPDAESEPVAATSASDSDSPKVYGSFSEETLYALLAAELAGQRNRFDVALPNYLAQARATGDAGVAERALRIAEYVGARDEAVESALIWAHAAPDDLTAQRAAAVHLARAGRYDESMGYMEKVLSRQGDTHFDFLALSAAETDAETRAGMLQSFDRLLQKHPENGQLLFGKALLLSQDDRPLEALELLEAHPASRQDVAPLLLRVRLLQSLKRGEDALPLLRMGLRKHPDDKRLRMAYARQLIELKRLEEAKGEFTSLLQQAPEDDDLRFSLALICLESEAWQEAAVYLEELIERDAHLDAAHFNLGRVREQLGDAEAAIAHYAEVGPGNEYLPAQLRQAELLMREKRLDEARKRLAQARSDEPDYAIQLYLIESEGLTGIGQTEQAWALIQTALRENPEDPNLLYNRAMLAEKRNDLAQLERDLRLIIERDPQNVTALNALGYTLADRTQRYDEALQLVEQAHSLNPDDPAILDSLGWINYRLGRLEQAEQLLRQAYAEFPDHEVAAHLGEVLWVRGRKKEARKLWSEALQQTPDSPILRGTLKRLTGSEENP
jgi:tetratricopeptide (TPR) repeat protein